MSRVDLKRVFKNFKKFHKENKIVYQLFYTFTMQVIERGYDYYSSDAICHRIRWQTNIETKSEDGFKINDHYTAYYSRLFMWLHPEHGGFFRTKDLPHEEEIEAWLDKEYPDRTIWVDYDPA
jgi:hypothetical protein